MLRGTCFLGLAHSSSFFCAQSSCRCLDVKALGLLPTRHYESAAFAEFKNVTMDSLVELAAGSAFESVRLVWSR